jgi:hypothetical protein
LVSAIVSIETSHIATLQPSATSWRASSRPMPVPPPVITANFQVKSFIAAPDLSATEVRKIAAFPADRQFHKSQKTASRKPDFQA